MVLGEGIVWVLKEKGMSCMRSIGDNYKWSRFLERKEKLSQKDKFDLFFGLFQISFDFGLFLQFYIYLFQIILVFLFLQFEDFLKGWVRLYWFFSLSVCYNFNFIMLSRGGFFEYMKIIGIFLDGVCLMSQIVLNKFGYQEIKV